MDGTGKAASGFDSASPVGTGASWLNSRLTKMKDNIKGVLVGLSGILSATALAFALFWFGPKASDVFAAQTLTQGGKYMFPEQQQLANGIIYGDGFTDGVKIRPATKTNFVVFADSNGSWLDVSTNQFAVAYVKTSDGTVTKYALVPDGDFSSGRMKLGWILGVNKSEPIHPRFS
jgi:hypothetical protein